MKTIDFSIITPTETAVKEPIDFLLVRTEEGDMGIRAGHQNCILILKDGIVKFSNKEKKKEYLIEGGVLLVKEEKLVILAEFAALPEEAESLKAKYIEKLKESYLKEVQFDLDIQRAEFALHSSLVHGKNISDSTYYPEED
ncbi:FoF1 ATP synthase subunit delta/epsilon [Anaerosphaera multitolerans]|uniref:ATP synthase epsilon chain n=1 Tax=Anaerosphaera multitolerans TaxID=2487351 RepID=A0A437S5S7_9FIRM|nr:F0F1 ATP synthase subunit epsilon [Anaerosphaera multitolerans]RVU54371.1 F0F1 ATP synthase subunit epsilon [Anaerosphaera multitolerans]